MFRTISRYVALAALLAGTVAQAQSLVPGQTRMRVGTTMLTIGPISEGRVLVEAWRGMDRVTGQVDPSTLLHWTDSSVALVDSRQGTALRAVTYEYEDGSKKVEYKSPYLMLGESAVMMLDRMDQGGESRYALYAADGARERRLYIIMTRSDVATLLSAMREAAEGRVAAK
jgi:hypothetical protein